MSGLLDFSDVQVPEDLYGETADVWREAVSGQDAGGALVAGWAKVLSGLPAFVLPMAAEGVYAQGQAAREMTWTAYLWRGDGGTLADVRPNDRLDWTDRAGVAHRGRVLYAVDESMGVYLKAVVAEVKG